MVVRVSRKLCWPSGPTIFGGIFLSPFLPSSHTILATTWVTFPVTLFFSINHRVGITLRWSTPIQRRVQKAKQCIHQHLRIDNLSPRFWENGFQHQLSIQIRWKKVTISLWAFRVWIWFRGLCHRFDTKVCSVKNSTTHSSVNHVFHSYEKCAWVRSGLIPSILMTPNIYTMFAKIFWHYLLHADLMSAWADCWCLTWLWLSSSIYGCENRTWELHCLTLFWWVPSTINRCKKRIWELQYIFYDFSLVCMTCFTSMWLHVIWF